LVQARNEDLLNKRVASDHLPFVHPGIDFLAPEFRGERNSKAFLVLACVTQGVFDAWTRPSALAKWWAPPGGRCVTASIDLRLGGRYSIVNELPDGVIVTIQGEYLTIEPPTLLRFTWATDASQSATETVTVTCDADGHDTKVTIVHTRLPSQEAAEAHKAGWDSCHIGLARFLGPNQE